MFALLFMFLFIEECVCLCIYRVHRSSLLLPADVTDGVHKWDRQFKTMTCIQIRQIYIEVVNFSTTYGFDLIQYFEETQNGAPQEVNTFISR